MKFLHDGRSRKKIVKKELQGRFSTPNPVPKCQTCTRIWAQIGRCLDKGAYVCAGAEDKTFQPIQLLQIFPRPNTEQMLESKHCGRIHP